MKNLFLRCKILQILRKANKEVNVIKIIKKLKGYNADEIERAIKQLKKERKIKSGINGLYATKKTNIFDDIFGGLFVGIIIIFMFYAMGTDWEQQRQQSNAYYVEHINNIDK
jgi:hypothetical protein